MSARPRNTALFAVLCCGFAFLLCLAPMRLALANTFDFNYTNKKEELAPMLHKLFGWGQAKLKTCLSTPCDKAERDELANLFKELCPPLYKTIMNWGELPQ